MIDASLDEKAEDGMIKRAPAPPSFLANAGRYLGAHGANALRLDDRVRWLCGEFPQLMSKRVRSATSTDRHTWRSDTCAAKRARGVDSVLESRAVDFEG